MKNRFWQGLILLFIGCFMAAFNPIKQTALPFVIPQGWSKPIYDFSKNPPTTEGVNLGRHLFYEPILSRDSTISCASCHLQATGFTHVDHDLSHGIDDKIGTRNSPALINLGWNKYFMWDGAVTHLDMQPLAPLSSVVEMDLNITKVVERLNQSKKYKTLFFNAFNDSLATGQRVLLAFSQFLLQLNSYNSKYDKFVRKEEGTTFTPQELNGLYLFRQHCANCHTEPLFTNQDFENNGLPIDTTLNDWGRKNITQRQEDALKFKVPTLRNIQFTYPYMHDGRFKKLREVVNHYDKGIQKSPTLSKKLTIPMNLSSKEKTDLVAFMLTLTDSTFLFDKRFNFPK